MIQQLMIASVAVAALAACGGKQGDAAAPAAEATVLDEGPPPPPPGPAMIPADKMDQVTRMLDRRRASVSRCLSAAVDAKELPKNARGKVALAISISPAGRTTSVKVIRSSLESTMLTDCVVERVQEIVFPELPRTYETSYTYGFEAM